MSGTPYVNIAQVVKTRGLEGKVLVRCTEGLPFCIYEGLEVHVVPPLLQGLRCAAVSSLESCDGSSAVIGLEGLDGIEEAEQLVGRFLLAHEDELDLNPEEDMVLVLGSPALAEDGRQLGTVTEYLETKANDVLVITRPDGGELLVELDPKLSPAANAQRYFKLYQKARSARRLAAEQKERTEEELNYLEGQLENLGKCTEEAELFEIRSELEHEGYVKPSRSRSQMKSLAPSRPLKLFASDGTVILVGKNNLHNDKLTASAQPNEIWLHAKDMPGSHVIIVGENPSDKTIGEAASLAAYYSKGRSSSRVPVDYTLRKYVKKPGGARPGFVIYTHQKTLYVQPREIIARD